MNKKFIIAVCAILMTAFVSGCSSENTVNTQIPQAENTQVVIETPQVKESEQPEQTQEQENTSLELMVTVDGKNYGVRVDSKDIIEALGDDYEYSSAVSCVYEGEDKSFEYDGITIYTVPVDGKDVIEGIEITSDKYSTSKGIKVGASMEEVVSTYGENYFMQDNLMTYSTTNDPEDVQAERIQFYFNESGIVETIVVYSPSY